MNLVLRPCLSAMLLAVLTLLASSASAGMTPEEVKRFQGLKVAADQGDAMAQNNLASCYYNGTGVAKDEVEAVRWYRKAADQGDVMAQCNLGFCYDKGTGVAKDEIEAYAYWNLSRITSESARKNLSILEKKMSPDARLLGQQRTKQLQNEIEGRLESAEEVRKAIER